MQTQTERNKTEVSSVIESRETSVRSPRLPFNKEAWERQQKMNQMIQQKTDEKATRYNEVNELLDRAELNIEKENETIGKLLHEVQQSRLYLVEFQTFEAYMEAKRPSLWRGTAYRWIDHAAVVTRLQHEAQKQEIEVAQLPSQSAAQHLARVKDDNELLVNWLGMCAAKQTTADQVKRFIVRKHGSPKAVKDKTVNRVQWSSGDDQGDGKKMLAQYAAIEVKTTEKAGRKQDTAKVKRDRLPALLHDLATFIEKNETVQFRLRARRFTRRSQGRTRRSAPTDRAIPSQGEHGDVSGADQSPPSSFRYEVWQYVALMDGETMPTGEQFERVLCRNLSCSGFSYLVQELPNTNSLIVALGSPPNLRFVRAEVVSCASASLSDGQLGHLIECRFVGRMLQVYQWDEEQVRITSASSLHEEPLVTSN